MNGLGQFRRVWLVDFEFHQPPGSLPSPLCVVAMELWSGELLRIWIDQSSPSPFAFAANDLFIAYLATAELKCFLSLGWSLPPYVLDLFVEFKLYTSGRYTPTGHGLLGALSYFGLPGVEKVEKQTMRELAMRGGAYSESEKRSLIDYCQTDVEALRLLIGQMTAHIDFPRALIRGEYMKAMAQIELRGVPIDIERLGILQKNWDRLKAEMISTIDRDFGVYEGLTFKRDRFSDWIRRKGIEWPLTDRGALRLDDDTFKELSRVHPALNPLRELRASLSRLRLNGLAVGSDGRNRCVLSPFGSVTSRNQPSTTQVIFGPSTWIRSLIRPEHGKAIAYVDYEQQEFGIAGALAKDAAMMEAYATGDPYLTFGKQAGVIPLHGTKKTHAPERELFKAVSLAVQYGMGETALAARLAISQFEARQLIHFHQKTYKEYWRWSEAVQDHAMLIGKLHTAFGWAVHTSSDANTRSLRNFPLQANGAEMLRLAIILATQQSIEICAPVHDALLVESPVDAIEEVVAKTHAQMAQASELVLPGFPLRTDAKIIRCPERYFDDRGRHMWDTVWSIMERISGGSCADPMQVPASS